MRFKSQAQAGFGALRQGTRGKLSKKCHTIDSRPEHDTSRHDLTDPSALVQIRAPVVSPLGSALFTRKYVRMCTRGPIRIPLLLPLRLAREALLQINVHTHQQGTAQNRVAEAAVVVLVVDAHRSV